MNVERFHALAQALRSDLGQTQLLQRLRDVQNALQQLIHEPHAGHQEGVAKSLEALHSALEQSAVDGFPAAWAELLRETGLDEKLGSGLRTNIDELFQRTQLTPLLAKEEIDKKADETGRLEEILKDIVSGFPELNIGSEELEGEDCEIGFLIPGAAIDDRLDRFAKELDEFNSIFRTFAEIATEKPANFEIRTISSGDIVVYLKAEPAVASFTAAALDRIITVYRQLIEIRKLRTELSEQDVPKEALEKLDQHSNSKMADAIDKIAVTLVLEYYPSEDGRRAGELANLLRVCLSKLANRIDRGYGIEVRAAAPSDASDSSEEEGDGKSDAEADQETYHLETIRRIAPTLQYMQLKGESILKLSEKGSRKALPWKKGRTKTKPVKAAAKQAAAKKTTTRKKAAAKKKTVAKKKKAPSKKRTVKKKAPARAAAAKKASAKKKVPAKNAAVKKAAAPKKTAAKKAAATKKAAAVTKKSPPLNISGAKVEVGAISPKIANLAAAAAGIVAAPEKSVTGSTKSARRKKRRGKKRRAAERKATASR